MELLTYQSAELIIRQGGDAQPDLGTELGHAAASRHVYITRTSDQEAVPAAGRTAGVRPGRRLARTGEAAAGRPGWHTWRHMAALVPGRQGAQPKPLEVVANVVPEGHTVAVELEELLNAMDRAEANLAKLESVWRRASSFIPTGPARGSNPEYDDLRRAWDDLLPGLPPIDGWTIRDPLPDIDELGQIFIDYFEISEPPFRAHELAEQPDKDLAEYRYRLNRARRRAARGRLQELAASIDAALPRLLTEVPRDSQERLEGPEADQVSAAVNEIERLVLQ